MADLASGHFPMGAKLPNEQEIADRFGVSRATVREAVGGLLAAGYVARRHGSGTYVTGTPRQHTLDANLSYLDMIRAAGSVPGLTLLSTTTRRPDADEASRLALDSADLVVCVERIRTADERPVVYSRDRIPTELLGTPNAPDAVGPLDASLYGVLDVAGASVRSAIATLLPVLADSELAGLLDVAPGDPLQYIDQTDYDGSGRPVMVSSEWHVPDILPLRVKRRSVQRPGS